jgi:substrate-binding family protein
MTKKFRTGGVLVVIILIIIVGYLYFSQDKNQGDTVTQVGVLLPLSGDLATWGLDSQKGINDVVTDNLDFVFEDTQCLPTETVNAFNKLAEFNNIKYLIGPSCGSPQEAIVPLVKDKDMVVILPVAASGSLYEQSGGKVFQLQYSIEDESKYMAQQFNDKGFDKVVLISYQNAFSQTHAKSFKENYSGELEEITFIDMTDDINTGITKIKQFNPDAIFVSDISFFLVNGLQKLEQIDNQAQVYSLYVTQYFPIRSFVEGVIYSFPGDMTGDEGAEYGLAKEAAEIFKEIVPKCEGEFECVLKRLNDSGDFNEQGISTRPLILKKIKNGQAVSF